MSAHRRSPRALLGLAVLLLCSCAARPGTVTLRIVDEAGAGIARATVIVSSDYGTPFDTTTRKWGYRSDDEGYVRFPGFPPWREWTVEAIAQGYVPNGITGGSSDVLTLRRVLSPKEYGTISYSGGRVGFDRDGVPFGYRFVPPGETYDLSKADLVPREGDTPGRMLSAIHAGNGTTLLADPFRRGGMESYYAFHQVAESPRDGYGAEPIDLSGSAPLTHFRTADGRHGMLDIVRSYSGGVSSNVVFEWVLQTVPFDRRQPCPHSFVVENFDGSFLVGEVIWD